MCNASNFCQFNDLLYTYDFHLWAENSERATKKVKKMHQHIVIGSVTLLPVAQNVLMKKWFSLLWKSEHIRLDVSAREKNSAIFIFICRIFNRFYVVMLSLQHFFFICVSMQTRYNCTLVAQFTSSHFSISPSFAAVWFVYAIVDSVKWSTAQLLPCQLHKSR